MDTAALPTAGKVAFNGDGASRPRRPAQQVERTQESALAALAAVASYLDGDQDLATYFNRLAATAAQHCGARQAAFWLLRSRGTLTLQPHPYGFAGDSPIYDLRLQLGARGDQAMDRMVFSGDVDLHKGTAPALDAAWRSAGLKSFKSSRAAPWMAGDRRLGAVAVYDSHHGFTAQDLWVLRLIGIAAGFLWQYRESENELGHTAVRLEEAITVRRHLLNNIAAGGDEARRRFASALHDDSLQLLTGAELQLERIRSDTGDGRQSAQLDQLRQTLLKVEDSLRRLLTNVSPEPLQLPGDIREAISDRLESMRIRAGIETHIDARISRNVPAAIQAIVLKNIAEALTNIEKHAHATHVTVVARSTEGGLRVEIKDDGTGFVVAESERVPGHIGLVAMRERAQLAGGWCRILSDPGNGTRIEFWLPLSQ